jgi:hypothetical protein
MLTPEQIRAIKEEVFTSLDAVLDDALASGMGEEVGGMEPPTSELTEDGLLSL